MYRERTRTDSSLPEFCFIFNLYACRLQNLSIPSLQKIAGKKKGFEFDVKQKPKTSGDVTIHHTICNWNSYVIRILLINKNQTKLLSADGVI